MKSLKYIIVLGIVTGVTFSSCEDWLDENPKYSVDNTVIFDSEETAKQALDACYGYLTTQDCFGQGVYEMSVGSSGLSWSQTNGSEPDRYASLNATTAGDAVLWAWRGLYKAIQECNTFIVNMNKGSLSEDLKENYTAQASFIRGLCYSNRRPMMRFRNRNRLLSMLSARFSSIGSMRMTICRRMANTLTDISISWELPLIWPN